MYFFKVLFVLLGIICLSGKGFAQSILKGNVTQKDNTALPFAEIEIRNATDSNTLSSTFTDSSGNFFYVMPAGKNGFVTVNMIGYTSANKEIRMSQEDTTVLYITLEPDTKLLEDVVIQSRKPLIERKADRTIFNVENSITAIGSDAYEMLKKAPGVQVNNGNVSMAGKSTVSVMLNDRLVQVTGSELESMLRSMSAGSISKIEVITAPPAKYDAEGNSGLINIVTKKSMKNGLNGNVTLTYEQRKEASQRLQTTLNYRQEKLNIYANINVNRFRFISVQQTNTEYPNQKQEQVVDQDNRPLYSWSQAGVDYNLSPRSILGFVYTLGTMDTKRDELIRTNVLKLPSGASDSLMKTDAFSTDKGRRNVFNLNYDLKLDTAGKKLSINADYFTRQGDNTRNFKTGNFYNDGTETGSHSDNHTYGEQNTDILATRADIEYPTKLVNFSAGIKTSWIHNYSSNVFNYLSGTDYLADTGKTNTFDYKENTQAAYISIKKDWGKWNAQLGLRAEYTQTRGQSLTLDQTNTNSYFKLFPSAYLQYQPNENHSWNINYTRRINRPSFWNMNPFRVYSTATAYEEGNPFLQPSFSNNVELGYAFKSILAFTVFMHKADGYATRVSFVDMANHSFHFGQANAGSELQYGLTATLTINPTPWWENTTELFGNYYQFSSSFYEQEVSYAKPSFSIETNNTFILNKAQTFMAEVGFEYTSRQQDDFDIQHSTYNLSAGIKAIFFQKKLTVSLNAEDILKTDIWQMANQYNGTYQRSYFDSRQVRLSLSWKFGNQFIKAKRERNLNVEESSRAN
jgi:outer membrane receptor protein involved in Fe transport